MTNAELLEQEISNSGMKISAIADKLGISREGFYKKLRNET